MSEFLAYEDGPRVERVKKLDAVPCVMKVSL